MSIMYVSLFYIFLALTPVDIGNFLKPVIDQANRLSCKLSAPRKKNPVVPKVTVSLNLYSDNGYTSVCISFDDF